MRTLSPFPTISIVRRRVEERLGRPVEAHQIDYVIESRDIQPVGRAGNAKIYDADAIDRIVAELQAIGARRLTSTAALNAAQPAA